MGPNPGVKRSAISWNAIGAVIAVTGLLYTVSYPGCVAAASLASRVSKLETQREEDAKRQERMEDKLDRILERVK